MFPTVSEKSSLAEQFQVLMEQPVRCWESTIYNSKKTKQNKTLHAILYFCIKTMLKLYFPSRLHPPTRWPGTFLPVAVTCRPFLITRPFSALLHTCPLQIYQPFFPSPVLYVVNKVRSLYLPASVSATLAVINIVCMFPCLVTSELRTWFTKGLWVLKCATLNYRRKNKTNIVCPAIQSLELEGELWVDLEPVTKRSHTTQKPLQCEENHLCMSLHLGHCIVL